MIMTCLNCARQHDFPDGWPARAAMSCWDCGALHMAERQNEVRLATPAELEGFKGVEAFRNQQRILAWIKDVLGNRKGMVPADEYTVIAKRAAAELGIEISGYGGLAGVGVASVNRTTGEVKAAEPPDCLHCLVLDLIQMRAIERRTRPSDDLLAIFRAACEMSVTYAKQGCDIDEHAKATGDMVAQLILNAHRQAAALEAMDMEPTPTRRH